MKLIVAIIRPERLEAVQEELQKVLDEDDNYRITVDAVEGHGAQHGEVELFRGQRVRPRMIPKTRIMVGVNDNYVEPTVAAILRGARTEGGGAVGDGKIFVSQLDECIRIRTGERGGNAI
ncbi:MAG: P-II family nitrogen regulator [Deltaproteobacteria bacterium]|nr:P-II family nitrogen regulator [Deltaproteobacteria bacterium]